MASSITRGVAWLRDQFQSEAAGERNEYHEELKEAESQTQKVTADLHALRQIHEELNTKSTEAEKRAEVTIRELTKKLELSQAELNSYKETADRPYNKHEKAANNNATLHGQLAKAKNTEASLRRSNTKFWSENQALRKQIKELTEVDATNAVQESPEYQELAWKYDEAKRRLDSETDNYWILWEEFEKVSKEGELAQSEINETKMGLEKKEETLQTAYLTIEDLKSQVLKLERELRIKEPLVEVGAAIRLRFLETSREVVSEVTRDRLDFALITGGNDAAHKGNGLADAALFKAGLAPVKYLPQGTRLFQALYNRKPHKYHTTLSQLARISDFETTVKVSKATNRSALERKDYDKHMRWLLQYYRQASSKKRLERDFYFEVLMARAEELADEIVDLDRGRKNRMGLASSPRCT